jgi:long-chain fatty acid transport protein
MPTRRICRWPVVLVFLFSFVRTAHAGFIETIGMDPRSSAMGGAATAVADTPSAWYYNPAGLAQIRGGTQELGLSQVAFFNMYERVPSGSWVKGTTPITYNAFFPGCDDYGLKRVTIGLGGGATFGGGSFWQYNQGNFRYTAYETMTLVNTFAPAVGVRVTSWLMLGGSVNVVALNKMTNFAKIGDGYLGDAVKDQIRGMVSGTLPAPVVDDLLAVLPLSTRNGQDDGKLGLWTDKEFPTGLQPTNSMDIDFRHVTYILGALAKVTDQLKVGVTYREETRFNYEGMAEIVFQDDALGSVNWLLDLVGMGIKNENTRFKTAVVMPREVVVGLAYQPAPWCLLATDFQWSNWAAAWDSQTTYLEGNGLLGMTSLTTRRDFIDTFSFRLGTEFCPWKGLRVQAGYWWDPTPVPNSTFDAATVDSDRHTFSLGAGYYGLFDGVLDITSVFQFLYFEPRYIRPYESVNLGGLKNYVPTGEPAYNDFPLTFKGNVINVGFAFAIHY